MEIMQKRYKPDNIKKWIRNSLDMILSLLRTAEVVPEFHFSGAARDSFAFTPECSRALEDLISLEPGWFDKLAM